MNNSTATSSNICVAVRVRPFTQLEKDMNSALCVQMEGNKTTLINVDDPKRKNQEFYFDYSFWSHD